MREKRVYYNEVKTWSIQSLFFLAVVNVAKYYFSSWKSIFQFVFSRSLVNFITRKREKRVYYNQVKFSSIQSFSLWKLLMLASFNFQAENLQLHEVVPRKRLMNFIIEMTKASLCYNEIKLLSLQAFFFTAVNVGKFFFFQLEIHIQSRRILEESGEFYHSKKGKKGVL